MPEQTEIEKYLLRMGWLGVNNYWCLHGSDDTYEIEEAHRIQSALDDTEDRRVWVKAIITHWNSGQSLLIANETLRCYRKRFPRLEVEG